MTLPFLLLTFPVIAYLLIFFVSRRQMTKFEPIMLKPRHLKQTKEEESVVQRFANKIEKLMVKTDIGRKIYFWYQKADLPKQVSPGYLVILNLVYLVIGFNLSNLFDLNLPLTYILIFGLEVIILIFIASKNAKNKTLTKSLPNFLESIGHTFEAYPDLKNSLKEAALSNKDARILEILKKTNKLIDIGHTPLEALTIVSRDEENPTLEFIVASVDLQQKTGANIAKFLITTAAQLRKQILTKLEIDQILFQNKVSSIIAAAIAPLIFLISASTSPNYREVVFSTPSGRLMLTLASLWWMIGVFITYRSVNVQK